MFSLFQMGGPALIDGKEHQCMDNFFPCRFVVDGIEYPSAENYFQCAKATNDADRLTVLKSGTGVGAWAAGQKIRIRADWQSVKVHEMYNGNLAKFQQNEQLKAAMIGSGNGAVKFIGSTPFWNHWNGLIMTRIRAELRQNGERDALDAARIREQMDKYAAGAK
jgi:predicted NAD-dependent protein-ADP-ribosyltransferase YbiA (DUF1768 family)